jgi:methionyl-tRNA formyltransferase
MDAGVDSGMLLKQEFFQIPEQAYAMQVYELAADKLGSAFSDLYEDICNGTVSESSQDNNRATYRAKRTPADGYLRFDLNADQIDVLIRAVSEPYPGAYTYYDGNMVKIWRVSKYEGPEIKGVTGQILKIDADRILVQTGDVPIWLRKFTVNGEEVYDRYFRVGQVLGVRLDDAVVQLHDRLATLEEEVLRLRKEIGGNA